MSEKPTVTIPDLHHVEIQTTIHVPIAAESLWREYEKERLNRKEEHK